MNWNKIIDLGFDVAKVATAGTPVGLAVTVVDSIVDEFNTEDGITNDDAIKIVETIAKSKHNNLDPRLICMVKAYLQCDKKDSL